MKYLKKCWWKQTWFSESHLKNCTQRGCISNPSKHVPENTNLKFDLLGDAVIKYCYIDKCNCGENLNKDTELISGIFNVEITWIC